MTTQKSNFKSGYFTFESRKSNKEAVGLFVCAITEIFDILFTTLISLKPMKFETYWKEVALLYEKYHFNLKYAHFQYNCLKSI